MKKLLFLLAQIPLFASVDNIRMTGATSTQAILAYTAPTAAACAVEVYDSTGMKASGLAVTGASNTSPIKITTVYDHYLTTGDKVYISGVGGNTNANGYSTVTVTGPKTFTLDGKAGNGTYTSGGTVAVLVHDLNTRLVAGADQDGRPGNVVNGRDRMFVIGARTAAKAADGRWYSRALQAATRHHFRIVCGADSATGNFQTTTIPLGNNYFDSWLADPDAPNQVAYPTVDFTPVYSPGPNPLASSGTTVTSAAHGLIAGDNIALSSGPQIGELREVAAVVDADHVTLKSAFSANQSNRPWIKLDPTKESAAQTIIDPQSGILMRPMTAIRPSVPAATPVREAWDNGTAAHWTASSGTLGSALSADDSNSVSFTGGAGEQPWLAATSSWVVPGYDNGHTDILSSQASNLTGFYNPSYVAITLKGSASAAGTNGSVDLCLSKNGVDCFTRVVTQDLNQCVFGCQVGDVVPVLKFWEDPSDPLKTQISRKDLYGRTGTGTLAGNTFTVPNTSQYFNLNWKRGSRITLGSTSYAIESVPDVKTVVLQDPPAPGTYAYTASNFSVLVRKTTPSPDTVTVQHLSFSIGVYTTPGWYYSGARACHEVKVTQTYNGVTREGYHCLVPRDAIYALYFVSAETGDATFLGVANIPGGSRGTLTWSSGACVAAAPSWHATDPNKFYCTRDGVVFVVEYRGDNLERHYDAYGLEATFTPLNAEDKNVEALVSDWVNANSPEAGTFRTNYCGDRGSDGKYMGFMCLWGLTDSYGWAAMMDLADESATKGRIVAARSSNGGYPFRYCGMHGNSAGTDSAGRLYSGVNLKSFTENTTSCGMGPFKVDHAAIPSTGGPCPANWNDFNTGATAYKSGGEPVCTDITITKEPYDPNPCPSASFDNGNSQPGDLGYLPGQGLRVGDKLCVGGCLSTGDREFIQLLRNNGGGNWTVLRGLGGHVPTAWASGAEMTASCPAEGAVQWWDVLADPSGTAGYSTLYPMPQQHSATRGSRRITEGYKILEGTIPQMSAQFVNGTYRTASFYVPFAGKTPNPGTDTHVSLPQSDAVAHPWGLDFAPLYANPAILPMPMASLGTQSTLWRLTPDGTHPALNRKYAPTAPACGNKALIDASGPNSKMDEGVSYAGRYCAIDYDAATECTKADGTPWSGASVGQVLLNCPSVTMAAQCGNYGYADGINDAIRPCFADSGPRYETTYQVGIGPVGGANDAAGRWSRTLGRHLTLPQRAYYVYANTSALPDASWALAFTPGAGGTQNVIMGLKLPPYPRETSENLATFVPISRQVSSVPPFTDNVVVEFGYDPQFRCGSRQETCVSVTGGSSPQGVNEKAPFFWAGESYTGVPCTAGCYVTVPAIPQRVVYYRLVYRASNGSVIRVGKTETAVSGSWE
jgi:hypothetical protein